MSIAATEPEATPLRPPPARLVDEGDSAPFVHAQDHAGQLTASNADLLSGKPVLLLFCPSVEDESLAAGLQAFRAAAPRLAALQATLLVICRSGIEANAAARARLALPFALLADANAAIFKGYGVDPHPAVPGLTLFLLDAGHRVARV